MKRSSLIVLTVVMLAGCYDPPYRTDVRGNGQGGVDIKRVAKDAEPPRPVDPQVESQQQTITKQQQEIDELKTQLRETQDQIKQMNPTPATQKASDHVPQN
jgi:TolA-binding protein